MFINANKKPVVVHKCKHYGGRVMWFEGIINIDDNQVYWQAKVYDTGSQYGINRGRISKLWASMNSQVIVSYDRGWDHSPQANTDANTANIAQRVLDNLLERFD